MRTLGAGVREGFEVRECEDGDRGDCGADRTQGSRRLLLAKAEITATSMPVMRATFEMSVRI
jgi:hypothetical protein